VRHAYAEVPFYRELMDRAGLRPDDIRSLKDYVESFPLTEAAEYKRAFLRDRDRFISSRLLPTLKQEDRSSGSTGIPTTVLRSHSETAHNDAKTLYHLLRLGLRPWHRTLAIVPPIQVVKRDSRLQKFGIFYRKTVDHFQPLDEVADLVAREGINAIYGRKAPIQLLAEKLAQRPDIPHFEVVIPGAEVIDRAVRQYLISRYRPRRYGEFYGCTEGGILATRRGNDPYLIDYNSVFVSLDNVIELAEGKVQGTVVLTSLYNRLQPFLKYKIDDVVLVEAHDRLTQLGMRILDIQGRQDDFLRLPDGSRMSAAMFKCTMEVYPFVWQYKIIQTELQRCGVLVALTDDTAENRSVISKAVAGLLESSIGYQLEFVKHIEPEATGKFKVIVSKVAEMA
jgi:phenylacetate-CoA ligase